MVNDATSTLLAHVPAATLNAIADSGDFELPVSGDDLAFARAEPSFDV